MGCQYVDFNHLYVDGTERLAAENTSVNLYFLELKTVGTTNLVTSEISIAIKQTIISFYISEILRS